MYSPTQSNGTHCTIYEKDGFVTIVEEYEQTNIPTIIISWKVLLFVIAVLIAINIIRALVVVHGEQNAHDNTVQIAEEYISTKETAPYTIPDSSNYSSGATSFYETGIVFPDSSSRILSSGEINFLRYGYSESEEEMVQYAINEIYARNGYEFKTPYWANYYSRYSWYYNHGYTDQEARTRFNNVEKENMKKLECRRDEIRGK